MMKKLSAAVLALVMTAGSGAALIGSADELSVDTSGIEVISDTAEDVQRPLDDEITLTLPTDDTVVTPDQPGGLKATKTTAGLKLTWNKVNNCEGYYVYRQHPNGDEYGYNFVYLTGSDTTSYIWSDYTDSLKDWDFAVVAYNREGAGYVFSKASLFIDIVDETGTSTGAPATPVFTSYNKTYDAVRLFWNPVACTGYEVEFNTNTGYWVSIGTVSSSNTNVRISKLNANTTYSFRMRAYNLDASGNKIYSDYTPVFQATTTSGKAATVSAPAKTTITKADTSADQITYHWNAVTCDGYQVYYNTTGNSSDWKLAGNFGSGTTSYTLSGLSANTTAWVTVRAFNKDSSGNPVYAAWADNYKATTGSSSSSTTVSAPAKVSITKIGRSTTAFRTYWNNITCDGYQIYLNSTGNASDWKMIGTLNAGTSNYRIEGLTANHDYWVTLRAFNKKSDGTYVYGVFADNVKVTTKSSSSSSSSSASVSAPSKVSITKTSKTYDAVRINWNAMSVSGYEVYLNSTGNSGDWKQVATLAGSATTCRISGLAQGHSYWVTIRAFNKDSSGKAAYGAYADNKNIVTKSKTASTTTNRPAATSIYKTSVSKTAARLNWNVQNCDGYLVYMLQNNTWKLVKGLKGSAKSTYRISKLYSGTTYFFKVKTFNFTSNNKKVTSADSNIVSVTTKK